MGRIWAPQMAGGALLLFALNPGNPYGYYTFLRIASFGIFGYLAIMAREGGRPAWAWAMGINALLYNPIIPVHLPRGVWSPLNILSALLLLASIRAIGIPRGEGTP